MKGKKERPNGIGGGFNSCAGCKKLDMAKKKWTSDEETILRQLFPNTKTEIIAKQLSRSYRSVSLHALALGLAKTEEYLREMYASGYQRMMENGVAYRFKKGNQPMNKGKPITEWMSVEGRERLKPHQFKKGERPKTAPPPGTVSILKHKGTGQLHKYVGHRMVHHIEWEKINGPIPKGYVLACRSGDTLNTSPDNWELITRAENMRRNTFHRFPTELKETIRVLKKLKRTINEKQNRRLA